MLGVEPLAVQDVAGTEDFVQLARSDLGPGLEQCEVPLATAAGEVVATRLEAQLVLGAEADAAVGAVELLLHDEVLAPPLGEGDGLGLSPRCRAEPDRCGVRGYFRSDKVASWSASADGRRKGDALRARTPSASGRGATGVRGPCCRVSHERQDGERTIAGVRYRPGLGQVDVDGEVRALTGLEGVLLDYLLSRAGHPVSRDELLREVWQQPAGLTRAVDTAVRRLRKKLGPGAVALQTVRGTGYRLVLDSEPAMARPSPTPSRRRVVHLPDRFVDLESGVVTGGADEVLSDLELAVLCALDDAAGRPISRVDLARRIRPMAATPRTLTAVVQRLRSKLEVDPAHPTGLLTVPGQGVRLRPWRSNLAPAARPFVGREALTTQVRDSLAPGRITSLVGPPGAGKTRLALEVCWRHAARPGGVWWVALGACSSLSDILRGITVAMGVPDAARLDDADAEAMLLDRLEPPCVLALDEAEGVVSILRDAVSRWLERVPTLQVLVTSRIALGAPREVPIRVGRMTDDDAADLLRARAAEVRPALPDLDGEAVAALVSQAGGLALAIELIAARLVVFDASDLRRRTDVPDDLVRTTERSWQHLEPDQRTALCVASMFQEPFDVASFEAVLPGPDAAAALAVLVSHSLVEQRPGGRGLRFAVPRGVRQFAIARLAERPRTAATLEVAALRWWRTWLEDRLEASDHRGWEHEINAPLAVLSDLRTALGYAERDRSEGHRLAVALCRWTQRAGNRNEALPYAQRAMTLASTPSEQLWALTCWACITRLLGGPGRAVERGRAGLEAMSDPPATDEPASFLWLEVARAHLQLGDRDAAEHAFRRSVDLSGVVGNPVRRAHAEAGLAKTLSQSGRHEEALRVIRRALAHGDRTGLPERRDFLEAELGAVLLRAGRLVEARRVLRAAVGDRYSGPEWHLRATVFCHLGRCELELEQFDASVHWYTLAADLAAARHDLVFAAVPLYMRALAHVSAGRGEAARRDLVLLEERGAYASDRARTLVLMLAALVHLLASEPLLASARLDLVPDTERTAPSVRVIRGLVAVALDEPPGEPVDDPHWSLVAALREERAGTRGAVDRAIQALPPDPDDSSRPLLVRVVRALATCWR